MATSQNGWPVLEREQLLWFTAAGGRFAAANADVAFLAKYLIERFDTVEAIKGTVLDDWSWAPRNIKGSTSAISNHASATAWDLNATQHPLGVQGTFSASEIAKVHLILAEIVDSAGRQVFRWGNDYLNRVDGMHIEINATATQVKQARTLLEQKETAAMAITDADAEKTAQAFMNQGIKLTKAAAKSMSLAGTPRKEGEKLSLRYILLWGGPGLYRLNDKVSRLIDDVAVVKAQQAQILAALKK